MSIIDEAMNTAVTPAHDDADGAVGVSGARWYVAVVNHNAERSAAERLARLGIESYVATQKEYRVYRNGRKAKIDRVVIPCLVFIRCTEPERMRVVALPFINRFMTDRAGTSTFGKPVAVIPDDQIQTLRFMLGQSDTPVAFTPRPYTKGDTVRVIRGSLRGLEGTVMTDSDGTTRLTVRLDFLGGASVAIDPLDIISES